MEEIRGTSFALIGTKITTDGWDLDATELQGSPYNIPPGSILDSETIDTEILTGYTAGSNPLGISITVSWIHEYSQSSTPETRSTVLMTLITDY